MSGRRLWNQWHGQQFWCRAVSARLRFLCGWQNGTRADPVARPDALSPLGEIVAFVALTRRVWPRWSDGPAMVRSTAWLSWRWRSCLSSWGCGLLRGSSAACHDEIRDEAEPQSSSGTQFSAVQLLGRSSKTQRCAGWQ